MIGLGWLRLCRRSTRAFAVTDSAPALVVVFLIYGLYFGLTEGVEKAWVADLAPAGGRGNAFGIYNAVIGFGALVASLLFGYVWTHVSPPAAFFTGAGFALAATALLYLTFRSDVATPEQACARGPRPGCSLWLRRLVTGSIQQ